jgi:hypothetical protein
MEKNPDPESGMKFFDAVPGSFKLSTLDPVWKKSDPGSGINIPVSGSASLPFLIWGF